MGEVRLVVDPLPSDASLRALWQSAWGDDGPASWTTILSRSLAHLCAYDGEQLVGFANVAWDGGVHAFLVDPTVHRDWQRKGIATRLVREAAAVAAHRGAHWLHVDYEAHLEGFYKGCGFHPTLAGLMRLV